MTKPTTDHSVSDLPADFFDTYPGKTEEERAEMKRLYKARLEGNLPPHEKP